MLVAILLGGCSRPGGEATADAGAGDAGDAGDVGEGSAASAANAANQEAEARAVEDGGPPVDGGAPEGAQDEASPAAAPEDGAVPGEARRVMVRRLADDPRLSRHKETLKTQYGDKLPWPLEVQTAALPGGREALLILGPPEAREPLVLVLDASGAQAWSKEMPLVGVIPGVRELAILGAPEGGVALAFCEPEGKFAAVRHWDAEGGIVADYEVVEGGGCAALSAAHWPGRGFVVAASGPEGARAQVLDRQGSRAWGRSGVLLPWHATPGAPVSIAPSGEGVVLLQAGLAEGASAGAAGGGASGVLAIRYDARGNMLWRAPLRVGAAPQPATARVGVSAREGGAVRALVGGRAVEIAAEGQIGAGGARSAGAR